MTALLDPAVPAAEERLMNDVLYADFSCPISYLASQRVDRLLTAGLPVPDWRAVEYRPRLPFPGLRLDGEARATRTSRLDEARLLLQPGDEMPAEAPGFLPHTASAVAAYAEAYEAGVADLVRPLLFRAYWADGLDIGDPEVLRRLLPGAFRQGRRTTDPVRDFGYAVTSQHAPVTVAAARRMRQWEQDWLATGAPVALTLVTHSMTLSDVSALQCLRAPAPASDAAAPAAPLSPLMAAGSRR